MACKEPALSGSHGHAQLDMEDEPSFPAFGDFFCSDVADSRLLPRARMHLDALHHRPNYAEDGFHAETGRTGQIRNVWKLYRSNPSPMCHSPKSLAKQRSNRFSRTMGNVGHQGYGLR